MSLELKLFGDLKIKSPISEKRRGYPAISKSDLSKAKTGNDLIKLYDINRAEIGHFFLNGKFAKLEDKLRDGDSLTVFPRNMVMPCFY